MNELGAVDAMLSQKIDQVVQDKAKSVIEKIRERYTYESAAFINENASAAKIYDPESAELKQFNAYKWVYENVKLKPEIKTNAVGNVSIGMTAEIAEGAGDMDEYRRARFMEIIENVQKKNSYGF